MSSIFSDDGYWDRVRELIIKSEDERIFQQTKDEGKIEPAVLICNKENKFKLLDAFHDANVYPHISVFCTELCGDSIYMVTDKELAQRIRDAVRWKG